jgi:spermidine/putrescine transport system ATP-binding protein
MAEPGVLLTLRSVTKSYGATAILHGVDLDVRDGEFITILGPSGSGKTTILRLIGGFTAPSGGEIRLDGQDITGVPINRRPFNTVFQDYALFPHLTVEANVAYGLVVRGTPRAEVTKRVADALELVSLGPFGKRYPAQLSGARGARPRHRLPAAADPARRAARRARRGAPPPDAGVPQIRAGRDPHHLPLRHA